MSIRTVRSTIRTVGLVDQDGIRTVNQDGFRTVFLSGGGGFGDGAGRLAGMAARWSRLWATSGDHTQPQATSGRFQDGQDGQDGLAALRCTRGCLGRT